MGRISSAVTTDPASPAGGGISIDGVHETVAALIQHYGMTPLPVEGTFFLNTWRSAARTAEGGPAGTTIVGLYCDDPPSRSLFHRLAFDEVWHFYAGDPLRLVLLLPDGGSEEVILGPETCWVASACST